MGAWSVSRAKRRWVMAIAIVFAAVVVIRGEPIGSTVFWLIALCFVCEFVDSSVGMGYGTTLTPVLLAMGFSPLQLIPSILFSEMKLRMTIAILTIVLGLFTIVKVVS